MVFRRDKASAVVSNAAPFHAFHHGQEDPDRYWLAFAAALGPAFMCGAAPSVIDSPDVERSIAYLDVMGELARLDLIDPMIEAHGFDLDLIRRVERRLEREVIDQGRVEMLHPLLIASHHLHISDLECTARVTATPTSAFHLGCAVEFALRGTPSRAIDRCDWIRQRTTERHGDICELAIRFKSLIGDPSPSFASVQRCEYLLYAVEQPTANLDANEARLTANLAAATAMVIEHRTRASSLMTYLDRSSLWTAFPWRAVGNPDEVITNFLRRSQPGGPST